MRLCSDNLINTFYFLSINLACIFFGNFLCLVLKEVDPFIELTLLTPTGGDMIIVMKECLNKTLKGWHYSSTKTLYVTPSGLYNFFIIFDLINYIYLLLTPHTSYPFLFLISLHHVPRILYAASPKRSIQSL